MGDLQRQGVKKCDPNTVSVLEEVVPYQEFPIRVIMTLKKSFAVSHAQHHHQQKIQGKKQVIDLAMCCKKRDSTLTSGYPRLSCALESFF